MSLRLAFMGTPEFAVPALAELVAAGHEIAAVYTQPPRPAGRGHDLRPSDVQRFAQTLGLEIRSPVSLKTAAAQADFAALDLDVAVVVAYGLILPKPVLAAPVHGCINIHASLLPRWRGAAPIQRAVMAGDRETGVMTMQMDEGLDTGPVLMAEHVAIGPDMTSGELHDVLAPLGANLIARTLGAIERGAIQATPQSEIGATYAKKIEKNETRIDWSRAASDVHNHVRGLSPSPGAWTEIAGERVRVLRSERIDGTGMPGTVLDDTLTIACASGAVRLVQLQRPGRAAMAARDFLRGFAVAKGTMLA